MSITTTETLRPAGPHNLCAAAEHAWTEGVPAALRYAPALAPHAPVGELRYERDALVIVGGPPAVGKRHLVDRAARGATVVGVGDLARLREELRAGRPVIATMTPGLAASHRGVFARHAGKAGRRVHLVYLDGDRALCEAGQDARGHWISTSAMDEQLAAWEAFKFAAIGEPAPASAAWPALEAKGFASVCVLDRAAADALAAIRFS